ncbi:hypothetical protein JTE90_011208 [Oedothorax gibbosus]|uniref:BTB domain-containing protein n=1 Tax=Oedothorax gibbosus TaxID=931172 RepID=A0AAV6VZS1_9ARAC|nr:hypothetical protein JTE90_011208 [Oedothorax gibbosus]
MGQLLSKLIYSLFNWDSTGKVTVLQGSIEICTCDWHALPSKLTTDISILVENRTFHASKDVLSYFSPLLKDYLEKNHTDKITLKNITPDSVEMLLRYMYTEDLEIKCQNIVEIYKSSRKLRMEDVTFKCIEVMNSENTTAYICKYAVASQLGMLEKRCKFYSIILWNLEKFIEDEEMLNLNVTQICEILTGAGMTCIKTNIKRYYNLFLLALKWLNHKPERKKHAIRIMCVVPFHRMPKEDVFKCIHYKSDSHIMNIPGVRRIILSSLCTERLKTEENK